ncbi:hypothetical protein Dsin_005995 [Dipteronia sinensis]|uniref:FCP1 homology domain-containing protein n=1 Tax=Dipteronia sinensis TaxID=43782 RepID=A0AAE0EF50_9ROSI|nr:hypothetical protein Dsin_005995 [Dipteronia sinensis]
MAEMEVRGQNQIEVRVPRPVLVWRGLLNWVSFIVEIVVQVLRGTPSLISYVVGLSSSNHRSLLAASSSSSPAFKPLPVAELPLQDSSFSVYNRVCDGDNDDHDRKLEKLTVVLDLDETLICAYETSSLPASIRTQAIDAGLNWFELECLSSEDSEGNRKVNYVTVFERPGLLEFLRQLHEFADIVLFTAGLEGYASPLVDKIDVEKRFILRFYRPSTVSTEYREHVKDLSCLSKDLCRTVIVDNNPFSFLLQPLNGIPCIPFSAGQPYDNQLLEVTLPLLKHLSLQKDIRPTLYERFRMPEWFQMHGIPASGLTV